MELGREQLPEPTGSLGNYRLGFCLFTCLFVSHDIKAGFWICFLCFSTAFAVSLNSVSLKPKGADKHQKRSGLQIARGLWKTTRETKQMGCASACRLVLKEFPSFPGHLHPDVLSPKGWLLWPGFRCWSAFGSVFQYTSRIFPHDNSPAGGGRGMGLAACSSLGFLPKLLLFGVQTPAVLIGRNAT